MFQSVRSSGLPILASRRLISNRAAEQLIDRLSACFTYQVPEGDIHVSAPVVPFAHTLVTHPGIMLLGVERILADENLLHHGQQSRVDGRANAHQPLVGPHLDECSTPHLKVHGAAREPRRLQSSQFPNHLKANEPHLSDFHAPSVAPRLLGR